MPSVAAYGVRLSPRLGLALGIWIPSHEAISLVSTVRSVGPVTSGGQIVQVDYSQQIAISQTIDRTYFGAALGFALREGLRVGASAFLVYERFAEFLDLFAGALTSSTQNGATASASIRGTPSQFAGRLGLGLQWDVAPAWSVAAAVKTPALALVTVGGLTTVVESVSVLPGAPPSVEFAQSSSPVSRIAEPWRLAAASAVAIGDSSLRAELDWQAPQGSRHGVFNGRAGLLRTATPDLTWGVGFFTDLSREDVRSGSLAVDYYGVSGGVDWRPPPVRAARGPGATWDMRASLAVRYAYGFGDVERLQANIFGPASASSTAPARVHALSVNLGGIVEFR